MKPPACCHHRVACLDVDGPVLWHLGTGRHLRLPADAIADLDGWDPGRPPPARWLPLARRMAALHLLEPGRDDLARLVPARSRLVLLLPDGPALWHPDPWTRDAGGHAYRSLLLSPDGLALWRACNGSRTVAQAARTAGLDPDDALDLLRAWTHPDVQALQLRDGPVRPTEPGLARLLGAARPVAPRSADQHGPDGGTTLGAFHADIRDAATHFDDVEPTVAHAFGRPHPALQGQPYGARLHDVLRARGAPVTGRLLEIGPGDGELGATWREHARALGTLPAHHLRLDASPALLALQAERQPGTVGILGDATALPLPDASVDLVVCNEVVADLPAVPRAAAADRIARFGLAPLPDPARYNLGAWQLVEQLARVLAPGGMAFLSEFGDVDEAPTETRFLGHPEVSIHFGHLATVAAAVGLQVERLPLPALLGMDLTARWLSRPSYEALRALCRARGHHLQARAWTADDVDLPWPVEGLWDVPVHQDGAGPVPTRFQALLLRRP